MNDNVQKLIDAGVIKVADRNQLPPDLVEKVNALSEEQVELLTHMKGKLSPELLKTYQEFIFQ